MRKDRYSGYRGRLSATDWLRRIAAVLAVLVVLVGGGLIAGQKFIVYTDGGLRVDLPFDREDASEEELGEITVVVEQPQPEPAPPVEEPEPPLRAIVLGVDSLLNGTALQQVQAAGANAVVLNMKDDSGKLAYTSGSALAAEVGANTPAEGLEQALAALSEADIRLIARVSCFRDHKLASNRSYAIDTKSGRRWVDSRSVRWSNPAKPGVAGYLMDIAKELSDLGFDEVLLDNWGYPAQGDGRLDYIRQGESYIPARLEMLVGAFLSQMQAVLEEGECTLSLYCKAGTLTVLPDQSGRTLAQMGRINGRIWMENPAEGTLLPQQSQMVQLVTAFAQDNAAHQAIWTI